MESSTPPPPVPSAQPHLTPQLCFNTTALRDFLRLSRSTVDDSLSLHLNALLTPSSSHPFTPNSTAARSVAPYNAFSRRQIPGSACRTFKHEILFPSWQTREDVITYCNKVADTPDNPPAPIAPPPQQQLTRRMAMPSDKLGAPAQYNHYDADDRLTGRTRTRNYWGEEQDVDERTDPYSARDYSYTREGKAQVLKDVLANEEGVERIIRSRTWAVLGDRCLDDGNTSGGSAGNGYESDWNAWREGRRR